MMILTIESLVTMSPATQPSPSKKDQQARGRRLLEEPKLPTRICLWPQIVPYRCHFGGRSEAGFPAACPSSFFPLPPVLHSQALENTKRTVCSTATATAAATRVEQGKRQASSVLGVRSWRRLEPWIATFQDSKVEAIRRTCLHKADVQCTKSCPRAGGRLSVSVS